MNLLELLEGVRGARNDGHVVVQDGDEIYHLTFDRLENGNVIFIFGDDCQADELADPTAEEPTVRGMQDASVEPHESNRPEAQVSTSTEIGLDNDTVSA